MDQTAPTAIAPHRVFTRAEWAKLRADTPLTLNQDDLTRLKSLNDPISLDEVVEIYLPIRSICRSRASSASMSRQHRASTMRHGRSSASPTG
jgi:pantothenate kinase